MNTKKLKILGFVVGGIVLVNLILAVILMVAVFKPKGAFDAYQVEFIDIEWEFRENGKFDDSLVQNGQEHKPTPLYDLTATGKIKNNGNDIHSINGNMYITGTHTNADGDSFDYINNFGFSAKASKGETVTINFVTTSNGYRLIKNGKLAIEVKMLIRYN